MAKSFNAVKISLNGRNKKKKERKSKLKLGKLCLSQNNKLEEVQTALVLWSFLCGTGSFFATYVEAFVR